jgi:hypothetical protein
MSATDVLNPLISALSGLGGVWLGGWLSDRRERDKRRTDFITRQLTELYGPLVSMSAEIEVRNALRDKISKANIEARREQMRMANQGDPNEARQVAKETGTVSLKLSKYEDASLREILMPIYRSMLSLCREKVWLTEPETRKHFTMLIEYVEILDRIIRDALPFDVLEHLDHDDEAPYIFYAHLEETSDRLKLSLTERKPSTASSVGDSLRAQYRRIRRIMIDFFQVSTKAPPME